ncbi:protein kinase superfamily protein [Striga asiatica]|uniref:Protein kinase superfamily protein n=1 Tax=Striga asiatica TaxID=4170 RepID=A0A5A7P671_STRAF|nr:protein kinase superfamily protein [Striga asiatica]
MGCFLCSGKSKKKANKGRGKKSDDQIPSNIEKLKANPSFDLKKEAFKDGGSGHIAAHTFTFRELAMATKNFRADCLLGEGGLGRVYKGRSESTSQFGVVLLEIITGRRAIGNSRAAGEHNLVAWARPLFKDRRKFSQMADPTLQGQYPARGLYQALAVAAMCVQEQPNMRPLIADVVTALTYLASQKQAQQQAQSSTPRIRRELSGILEDVFRSCLKRDSTSLAMIVRIV